MPDYIRWFDAITLADLPQVGGKNASLGEMITHLTRAGVKVPNGFATTAQAFQDFLHANNLQAKIQATLNELNVDDINALTTAGKCIRDWIAAAEFSPEFIHACQTAYEKLTAETQHTLSVAVRSSATAEDLPEASFAGQQETILNVTGFDNVLAAIKTVFASLYNDRAIAYRAHQGFTHSEISLSAGIQRMARSDLGASGVMFTLDTESGFMDTVFITAAYGLGELIVQGSINPDEFYLYKPALAANRSAILSRTLGSKKQKMIYSQHKDKTVEIVDVSDANRQQFCITNQDMITLAQQAVLIEKHYQCPVDIEWAKDGADGQIYILQARPETVKSRANQHILERFHLKNRGSILTTGRSIGQRIGQGQAKIVNSLHQMDQIQAGDVLVTDMTDPDWEPVMKKAAAIVTNRGGRTCHAAIVARELGIPAVVGCGDATDKIQENAAITVSCAEGDTGFIYAGLLDFERREVNLTEMPELPFKIMLNVANPERAFAFHNLPNHGVGLARLEFIIARMIGIHPQALLNFETLTDDLKQKIAVKIAAYGSPVEYYVERLKEGIATIAAAFHPHPVIVRLSDFKTNEYASLLGGEQYEQHEENPMLGFRGASRYVSPSFRPCFELECQAVKRVRDEMGLSNVQVMIPFVRTVDEAEKVIALLADNGLKRGDNALKIIMMCEVPSNAILADQFLEYFDGFSIGSNDLTQLTLGLDRDSATIAELFDERDTAVKALMAQAIHACNNAGKYVGICGQAPSDHPDLAKWLMQHGIQSVSLNPDSVVDTWLYLSSQR